MNKLAFILLLTTTGILSSCKKEAATLTLGIDVQSSFDHDNVQIFVDGHVLINKTLQTNYALGVCLPDGRIMTLEDQGDHEIKVIVNNSINKTERFFLNSNLYIGVNYEPQQAGISFVYSHRSFVYD